MLASRRILNAKEAAQHRSREDRQLDRPGQTQQPPSRKNKRHIGNARMTFDQMRIGQLLILLDQLLATPLPLCSSYMLGLFTRYISSQ
jgi:hypothetical protein